MMISTDELETITKLQQQDNRNEQTKITGKLENQVNDKEVLKT